MTGSRLDCSKAENFHSEFIRYCTDKRCDKCRFANYKCSELLTDKPQWVVEFIQLWSNENPEDWKTYLQDFKDKFPKRQMKDVYIPTTYCRKTFYGECRCTGECVECWNTKI